MALADLVTINFITITHGHNNTVWTIAANNQSIQYYYDHELWL
jgi:hypothetical protein